VLVGRTGTRILDPTQPALAFMADIGFALLMFIVGTHLPMRDERLRRAARRGLVAAACTATLSIALAPLVAEASGLHRPAVIAVLIASSSAAVILPIVSQAESSEPMLVTIAWVTFLDVATLLAVPLVLAQSGVARAAAGAALVVALAAGVGLAGAQGHRFTFVAQLRHASHRQGWGLDLRVSLLVLFALAWVAERFDTSVLIAGFAVGAMVSLLGPPRRVAEQLIGLGEGFFVPLFFVVLGARLDARALVHSRSDVRLLVLIAVATSIVPLIVTRIVRVTLDYGLLVAAHLGVPAAVASIGLANGELRPGQAAAIVGASAISLAVTAVGAARLGLNPAARNVETD
jgi:Kef-type K+ transport system membrane component KefB